MFRISRLHFLTGQSGWMDGPTDLYFLFFKLKSYIFYWTIKHRAVGPCLSHATGHGGGPGTVVVGPCRARAGPKCRAAGRANGPRAAWPIICTNAGSSTAIWVLALSFWMKMGIPLSSAGHLAFIAGRTLFTIKSRLTSLVTDFMAFVTGAPGNVKNET